jgi:hypothetical protein
MKKLSAVEDARAVMREGLEWGVWKWLTEKKRLRAIADQARAALDEAEDNVKATWPDEYKLAYNQMVTDDRDSKHSRKNGKGAKSAVGVKSDPKVTAAVRKIKEADDEAYNAHEDAEEVFAEAERNMSTDGARKGARMALIAYDTHEAAIKKAEALARVK